MNIVIMVGQLLLGLSILVILHELGHFLAARAFGIKVEKFYLFFDAGGVSLFKFTYKDIEYGIGWLPLGGYVKIAGMIDESMDTEQLTGPPQPWEFRSKPAWQRLIVMLGGIIVNIVLGIFIFWMLTLKYGETYTPNSSAQYGIVPGNVGRMIGLKAGDKIYAINGKPVVRFEDLSGTDVLLNHSVLDVQRGTQQLKITVPANILNDLSDHDHDLDQFISIDPRHKFSVDSVVRGSNAQKAGLLKGDSIVAVNSTPIGFFDELQDELAKDKNKKIQISVKRNGAIQQLNAQVTAVGTLGFEAKRDTTQLKTIQYGFLSALPVGASRAWGSLTDNAKGLGKIFTGDVKLGKAIAGPVAIATMFGGHVEWVHFWKLVGLLSMALALMNLLPIPALDGGHSLFLLFEMVTGKPLSDKFLERAQIVGFVLIIALMIFVFGNDILKIVHKH